jgi:hypothetical protein
MKRRLGVVRIYQSFGVYPMHVFDNYQIILDCAKSNLLAFADELEESGMLGSDDKSEFLAFLMEGVFGFLLGDDCECEE